MSPQDFRRMVLAWELIPQNAVSLVGEEASPASQYAGSPPADQSGSPAIPAERLRDA